MVIYGGRDGSEQQQKPQHNDISHNGSTPKRKLPATSLTSLSVFEHRSCVWSDVQQLIRLKTGRTIHLTEKDIILYFDDKDMDKDLIFFIQLLLILGKYHIHKKKWTNSKPNIIHFSKELHLYSTTIEGLNNKKAKKTLSIIEKLKVNFNV